MLLTIAAIVVVIGGAVVAIAPARRAIADWLGIGAVEIRRSDRPLPTGSNAFTVPGAPGSLRGIAATEELAAARRVVQFTIATPHATSAGALSGVEVDRRVPGGLVVLQYGHFTLVEIATQPSSPLIGKLVNPSVRINRQP